MGGELERRLSRLERQTRALGVALALAVGGCVLLAAAKVAEVSAALRFDVRDDAGRLRGRFGQSPGGSIALTIWDENGRIVFRAPGAGEKKAGASPAPAPKPAPPDEGSPAYVAAPKIGREYQVGARGIESVFVCKTDDAWDALHAAVAAGDRDGIAALLKSGDVFEVRLGTRVKLIDTGLISRKVRVLSGEHEGEAGWIPMEWLQ